MIRSRTLSRAFNFLDAVLLGALAVFLIRIAPKEILNSLPATGGDTGSHFWPLHTLLHEGLPNGQVRIWNPGNLGGEPHLVHYFPLPYFVMAFLSLFMSDGEAFNLGTYIPVVLLPFSVYLTARLLNLRWPTPIISALTSTFVTLSEGYSMWGGNLLSTLAGQFAHMYALNFFFLGVGTLGLEIRGKRKPFLSPILFAGVIISHSYLMLGLPLLAFGLLIYSFGKNYKDALKHLVVSGLLSALLSLWFLVPLLMNAPWTTPFSMKWRTENLLREAFPPLLDPMLVVGAASLLTLVFFRDWVTIKKSFVWIILGACYTCYYFIFPALGLVDIRALPQVVHFAAFAIAVLTGEVLGRFLPVLSFMILPLIYGGSLGWISDHTHNDVWTKWNYSGWQSKKLYPDLQALSDFLRGTFSDGRVAYEHSDINSAAGSLRVFEMLPYFASRATLESLYMQATLLALPVYHFQSEISKTPSCPFPELKCSSPDLLKAKVHMDLLGATNLILISDDLLSKAKEQSEWLKKEKTFGPWHLFKNQNDPKLVEVLNHEPEIIDRGNFKESFYQWFREFYPGKPFLISLKALEEKEKLQIIFKTSTSKIENCSPTVQVDFHGITLNTNCPGKLHLLKFAYHFTWKANTGDELYLISPGMIALVPSAEQVRLTFGDSIIWRISGWISCATFFLLISMIWHELLAAKKRSRASFD